MRQTAVVDVRYLYMATDQDGRLNTLGYFTLHAQHVMFLHDRLPISEHDCLLRM
jgi:hypothetical protein